MGATRFAVSIAAGAGWLAVAVATAACNTALGLDGYSTHTTSLDGGHLETTVDASPNASDGASDSAVSCDVDLAIQCYACAPTETPQFLNACTNSACVPFDDVARLTRGLSDGGLPPLPPTDGGFQ